MYKVNLEIFLISGIRHPFWRVTGPQSPTISKLNLVQTKILCFLSAIKIVLTL